MHKVKMEDWICRVEGLSSLTRQNLEQLQLDKLNKMLERLKARGGIYKDLPGNLKSLEDIKSLPFTTAKMLKEHPEHYLSCSQSKVSRVISQATSGTTGGAKRVFYSQRDLENTVGFFASGISEMLSRGEKCLIAFPFSGPSGLGDLIAKAVESLGAVAVKCGFPLKYSEFKELLETEKPECYIGFPVPLLSMARIMGDKFPIKRALISGDACPEAVFESLSEILELYPHYGSRETALGGAVTCPAFEGMHLRENHIIAEIIDKNGNPLPDGQWGELCLTTIGLEAMPLIRYRTGDISRIIPGKCLCGGVTKRLDTVVRKKNGKLSIEELDEKLFYIPGLIDYSASFDGKLHINALVQDYSEEIEKTIKTIYPDVETEISMRKFSPAEKPSYPGKRHIII